MAALTFFQMKCYTSALFALHHTIGYSAKKITHENITALSETA
jgi:hypothetical protein